MKLRPLDSPRFRAGARHYSPVAGPGLRFFAISLAALLCLAPVAAPVLAAHGSVSGAGMIYLAFAPACHQRPARSFELEGHAWAVCHRCSGIYCGLLAGVALPGALLGALLWRRRAWTLFAAGIVTADFLANYSGIATNTSWSRFGSGFAFGAVAGALVLAGLAEVIEARGARWSDQPRDGDRR